MHCGKASVDILTCTESVKELTRFGWAFGCKTRVTGDTTMFPKMDGKDQTFLFKFGGEVSLQRSTKPTVGEHDTKP